MSEIIIIVDTREKANKHILDMFDKFKVKYVEEKLDVGDYSCYYIDEDKNKIDMRNIIAIERKRDLNELCSNFTTGRKRFEREFQRKKGDMIVLVESGSYKDIILNKYRSKMTPKSLLASIHSWSIRYDVPFLFIHEDCMAVYMYNTFKYYIKEQDRLHKK